MHRLLAQALLDPDALGPAFAPDSGHRINVYRNNYLITLGNALRTTFPAVERLVGDEFFAALACAFAERHPPLSPIMTSYGDVFPDFLQQFAALADFPYLPDVARLEHARVQAYHAADADPFDLVGEEAAMSALDRPASLHPSARIIASPHPVHSIWRAQVSQTSDRRPDWLAETVIVWRHHGLGSVEVMLLSQGEVSLLEHLAEGGCLVALLSDCPDQPCMTALVSKFIELAAAGIIVPARLPLDEGDSP